MAKISIKKYEEMTEVDPEIIQSMKSRMVQLDSLILKPMIGLSISQACETASKIAQENNKNVEFDFNGIMIKVTPSSLVEDILEKYQRDSIESHVKWSKSPEAKKIKDEEDFRRNEVTEKAREFSVLAERTDLSDIEQGLFLVESFSKNDGFCLATPEVYERLTVDLKSKLESHGITEGMNAGSAFDVTDNINCYHYILGQLLSFCMIKDSGLFNPEALLRFCSELRSNLK